MIECREREVHHCCLKSYGVFYFSSVWYGHIPHANCSAVVAAPGSYVMAAFLCGFNSGVMLIMLFNIL